MLFGNDALKKLENAKIVLEIELEKPLFNILKEEAEVILEATSGNVTYKGEIEVYFTDNFSGSRGQVQSNSGGSQMTHGNRVKIRSPKEYNNLEIIIPFDRETPVYLSKGKDPYKGRVPNKLKDVVEQIQHDRKYYDIIFDHSDNQKEQARAAIQMIQKNKDIIDFRFHAEKALKDKVKNSIVRRDGKENNNV